MTVHDDDAEWLREHAKRGRYFSVADLERVERILSRLSPTIAEGVLREALVEVSTALQLLIERQGEHILELPGATGVSDIDRADLALGKARAALEGNT